MHRHDNTQHSPDGLPIHAWAGETRPLPQGGVLDVARVVAEIVRIPHAFRWTDIPLSSLAAQIRGSSKLNFHYVAIMERDRARRPLLLGPGEDGGMLLLDGRHRAARSLQLGYSSSPAWVLTAAQMADFSR